MSRLDKRSCRFWCVKPCWLAREFAFLVMVVVASSGCAQTGPKFARQTQVGALRETVGQLETEKGKLEKEVASLNSENQRLEDRLVQEQAHTEMLSSRLDETRRLTRGVDLDNLEARSTASNRRIPSSENLDRRTTPANQKGRKAPFAQIPGEIRPMGNGEDRDSFPPSKSRTTPTEDEPSRTSSDLFSHQDSASTDASLRAARQRWLSLASDSSSRNRTE